MKIEKIELTRATAIEYALRAIKSDSESAPLPFEIKGEFFPPSHFNYPQISNYDKEKIKFVAGLLKELTIYFEKYLFITIPALQLIDLIKNERDLREFLTAEEITSLGEVAALKTQLDAKPDLQEKILSSISAYFRNHLESVFTIMKGKTDGLSTIKQQVLYKLIEMIFVLEIRNEFPDFLKYTPVTINVEMLRTPWDSMLSLLLTQIHLQFIMKEKENADLLKLFNLLHNPKEHVFKRLKPDQAKDKKDESSKVKFISIMGLVLQDADWNRITWGGLGSLNVSEILSEFAKAHAYIALSQEVTSTLSSFEKLERYNINEEKKAAAIPSASPTPATASSSASAPAASPSQASSGALLPEARRKRLITGIQKLHAQYVKENGKPGEASAVALAPSSAASAPTPPEMAAGSNSSPPQPSSSVESEDELYIPPGDDRLPPTFISEPQKPVTTFKDKQKMIDSVISILGKIEDGKEEKRLSLEELRQGKGKEQPMKVLPLAELKLQAQDPSLAGPPKQERSDEEDKQKFLKRLSSIGSPTPLSSPRGIPFPATPSSSLPRRGSALVPRSFSSSSSLTPANPSVSPLKPLAIQAPASGPLAMAQPQESAAPLGVGSSSASTAVASSSTPASSSAPSSPPVAAPQSPQGIERRVSVSLMAGKLNAGASPIKPSFVLPIRRASTLLGNFSSPPSAASALPTRTSYDQASASALIAMTQSQGSVAGAPSTSSASVSSPATPSTSSLPASPG